ncbi:MAG: 4-hydroxy-3-methylbut-2-enyl diphosphate reductase, partial [Olsenella sp.]
ESSDELDPSWFIDAEIVGITAGASTPASQIEAVRTAIAGILGEDAS